MARRAKREAAGFDKIIDAEVEAPQREYGTGTGSSATSADNGPTEKQLAFIARLRAERDEDDTALPSTKKAASDEINRLMALPKPSKKKLEAQPASKPKEKLPDVPAGYYAIDNTDSATNSIGFYRVDRPTKGKWEGFTFVKRVVGGRVDERVPRGQTADILQRIIKAGIDQAGFRYGQEIGQCCACNHTLTNDESRAKGIGPECANK
jgi:hypothetical protein